MHQRYNKITDQKPIDLSLKSILRTHFLEVWKIGESPSSSIRPSCELDNLVPPNDDDDSPGLPPFSSAAALPLSFSVSSEILLSTQHPHAGVTFNKGSSYVSQYRKHG